MEDSGEERIIEKITGDKKQSQRDAGLLQSESGAPSAGGQTNDDKFLAEYAEGSRGTPADHKRAQEILTKIQRGG